MNHVMDTAIFSTMIPLSIFTKIFHERFQKHLMLESTIEIIQHFYVQMTTEPDEYELPEGVRAYPPEH